MSYSPYVQWDVHTRFSDGTTPLHHKCKEFRPSPLAIKRQIELGADVNIADNNGNTPAFYLVENFRPEGGDIGAYLEILKFVLDQPNVDINHKRKNGKTLLHLICERISVPSLEHKLKRVNPFSRAFFQFLIEKLGANLTISEDFLHTTPISIALNLWTVGVNDDVVIYLLEKSRENINQKVTAHENTIVHFACQSAHTLPLKVLKYIIEKLGGDLNVKNAIGDTPIHSLFKNPLNKLEILDKIKYLFEIGNVDGNQTGHCGRTILHLVSVFQNGADVEVLKFLVEYGCNVNLPDVFDLTPLDYFIRGHLPSPTKHLDYLFSLPGIDVNRKGQDGRTILHYACSGYFSLEFYHRLIELGGDMNSLDNNGKPAYIALSKLNSPPLKLPTLLYLLKQPGVGVEIAHKDEFIKNVLDKVDLFPFEFIQFLFEEFGGVGTNVKMEDLKRVLFNKNGKELAVVCEYLLGKYRGDINDLDGSKSSLMDYVCANIGNIPASILPILIEQKKAKLSILDDSNSTPLYHAFEAIRHVEDLPSLRYLLSRMGDDTEFIINNDNDNKTALLNPPRPNGVKNTLLNSFYRKAALKTFKIPFSFFKFFIDLCGDSVSKGYRFTRETFLAKFLQFHGRYSEEISKYLLHLHGIDIDYEYLDVIDKIDDTTKTMGDDSSEENVIGAEKGDDDKGGDIKADNNDNDSTKLLPKSPIPPLPTGPRPKPSGQIPPTSRLIFNAIQSALQRDINDLIPYLFQQDLIKTPPQALKLFSWIIPQAGLDVISVKLLCHEFDLDCIPLKLGQGTVLHAVLKSGRIGLDDEYDDYDDGDDNDNRDEDEDFDEDFEEFEDEDGFGEDEDRPRRGTGLDKEKDHDKPNQTDMRMVLLISYFINKITE
jgi:ankyrin repeat protein